MTPGAALSRRTALGAAAFATAAMSLSAEASAGRSDRRAGKINVAGLGVYYEIHDGGGGSVRPPLVLLHGGAMTIETAFSSEFIARFSQDRTVIAIEQQGHGHTGDRPTAPFTMDRMVQDTAEVLRRLEVQRADILGHSLGGIVGTGVAIRRPELVNSLTAVAAPWSLSGFREEIEAMQRDPTYAPPEAFLPLLPTEAQFGAWRASFERAAPDPAAFDRILERLNAMLSAWPGWTADEIGSIAAPTLVVVGDNDYVEVDHALDFSKRVQNGRLAVLPGTTHLGILQRAEWLESMMASMAEQPV